MFEQFPYTNFHEINLDWILRTLKEKYGPDNPPQNVVLSVNGQTGDVVIFPDAIIRLPDVDDGTWNIHRLADGVSRGIQFTPTGAERIEGAQRYKMYDEGHPPEYPVTSVNGQTGTITISIPVQSVNGQIGAVVLYTDALVRWPDVQDGTWNLWRSANGVSRGIQFTPNGAERIEGATRYLFYDSSNLPALVSDRDDAILELNIPTETPTWGFARDVVNGTARIYLDTTGDTVKAYISFTDLSNQTVTYPLLTSEDIPASAGVISINGKTGIVTIYGSDIPRTSTNSQTVEQALTANASAISAETNRATAQETVLSNNIQGQSDKIVELQKNLAILVNGDVAETAVPAGKYAYLINNTHGLSDGLYVNSSGSAFPVSGGTADNTVFTKAENGGFNSILGGWETAFTDTSITGLTVVGYKNAGMHLGLITVNGSGTSAPAGQYQILFPDGFRLFASGVNVLNPLFIQNGYGYIQAATARVYINTTVASTWAAGSILLPLA